MPTPTFLPSPHTSFNNLSHSLRPSLRITPDAFSCFHCSYLCASWTVLPPPLPRSAQRFYICRRFRAPWFSSQEMISKVWNAQIDPSWDRFLVGMIAVVLVGMTATILVGMMSAILAGMMAALLVGMMASLLVGMMAAMLVGIMAAMLVGMMTTMWGIMMACMLMA